MRLNVFSNSPDEDGGGAPPTPPPEQKRSRPPSTFVRYGAMNYVGEFTYRSNIELPGGAPVVIQTDRGIELGTNLELCGSNNPHCPKREQVKRYVDNSGPDFCRPNSGRILRVATPQDVDEHRRLNATAKDDIRSCARVAAEQSLDMKIVTAEHLLGGERIVFYFRSEGRIDFRTLVKELARSFRTRIEMRQVGARDEARLVADWEVCGRECCCKNFLKHLRPVNMKMAKLQKSTLDPAKVSGRCGRLRCCLRYEHEGYQELAKKLPRRGKRIKSGDYIGTVVDHQVLTQLVLIRTDDQQLVAVPMEEITDFDLPKPPPPSEMPAAQEQREAPGAERPPRRGRSRGPERGPRRPLRDEAPPEAEPEAAAPPPAPPADAAPPQDKDDQQRSSNRRRRRRNRRRRPDGSPGGGDSVPGNAE